MPRSSYRVLTNPCPHFLTATINHWLPLFTNPKLVDIVLDSWRYLQSNDNFQLYGYVILENHLHLIAASENLSRDIQRFKSYTAKQLIAYLEQHRSNNWNYWHCLNGYTSMIATIRFGKKAAIRK